MTDGPIFPAFRGNRPLALGVGSALAGFAYLAFAFRAHRREVCFAYLTAFAFVASVAVGALFFVMIHHAAGAHWNTAVRRLNEVVVGTLPALFVLFLPLLFVLGELYPWARDTARLGEEARALLAHQRVYLNPRGYLVRSLLYFGVWGVIAGALRHRSFAHEARQAESP
ncbi:MAG TPA: hypothetical protein VGQ57_21480, partial [Polyangiaceae bacterium]|nr:hypothetical protein [Polyangiaceae bacterium]